MVGEIAAGTAFSGFLTDRIDNAEELDWVEVPKRLRGSHRFVVRIVGDSMKPTLENGDLVVFEYHRRPRRQEQIVLAALAEFGISDDHTMTETIKRLRETESTWEFTADNPDYPGFSITKHETTHPILGTMVGKL